MWEATRRDTRLRRHGAARSTRFDVDTIHRAEDAKEPEQRVRRGLGRKPGDAECDDGHVETKQHYVHTHRKRYGTWDTPADIPSRTPPGCAPPP